MKREFSRLMYGLFGEVSAEERRKIEAAAADAEGEPDPNVRAALLLTACASPDAAVAERAARELGRLLGRIPRERLPAFDGGMRSAFRLYLPRRFPAWMWERDAVRHVRLRDAEAFPALALLSMLSSGYAREDAVARLALHGSGDELPYLLLRANDWVAPVRERAQRALAARLVPQYADAWAASLQLVVWLRGCGRAEHGPLVAEVLRMLGEPACLPAVTAGLASEDRAVRRTCYEVVVASLPVETAVRTGLESADPVIRLRAARLAEKMEPGAFAELLPHLANDRFVAVRTLAAIYADRLNAGVVLRALAVNPAATPRGIAAAAMAKRGLDVRRLYRSLADYAEGGMLATGVTALGERGTSDDLETVSRFLAHPLARVRAAAVDAVARLGSEKDVAALVKMVGDGTPAVSRTAMRALERARAWIAPDALEALFAAGRAAHVRRNALRLMARRGRWTGIIPVLRAMCDPERAVAGEAERQLRRWIALQRSANAGPTAEEHARFRQALETYGRCVGDEEMMKALREYA